MSNQTNIITCPACGAPSEPEAGKTHMPCAYCGTTLTILESLSKKAIPLQKAPTKETKFQQSEIDPSDLLRKAQPIGYGAFNLYALWTWIRWFLPACLIAFIASIILCLVLGTIPVIWSLIR